MWILFLLSYASAMECYTDAPALQEDPLYDYVVTIRLNKTGRYVIDSSSSVERFVFGTGESLDLEGTSDLEGPVELYDFDIAAPAAIHYRFNKDPRVEEVPSIDLNQPFEIITEGSTISLIQNELFITEINNYIRMSIRIGWRNGTLCLDYFDEDSLQEEPLEEEPLEEKIVERVKPSVNHISLYEEL